MAAIYDCGVPLFFDRSRIQATKLFRSRRIHRWHSPSAFLRSLRVAQPRHFTRRNSYSGGEMYPENELAGGALQHSVAISASAETRSSYALPPCHRSRNGDGGERGRVPHGART